MKEVGHDGMTLKPFYLVFILEVKGTQGRELGTDMQQSSWAGGKLEILQLIVSTLDNQPPEPQLFQCLYFCH